MFKHIIEYRNNYYDHINWFYYNNFLYSKNEVFICIKKFFINNIEQLP